MPQLVDKALTDQAVKKLKPANERYEVRDSAGRGLGLRIAPSGSKTWFAMKRMNGKNVRATLGHYPSMSLAQARADAVVVLNQMAQGTYAKGRSSGLFDDLFDEWLKRDQAGNRTLHEVERSMRKDAVPAWQGRQVDTITRPEIIALLDRVVDREAKSQANRLLTNIKRFFNWCIERGELEHSPAAKVRPPTKEVSRDRVLSENELTEVWLAASETPYPFGPMFRLLILTGQRRSEVARAEWAEFDIDTGTWTIPASRAKNAQKHIVHLSDEALALLAGIPRLEASPYLFTTTGTTPVSGFSKAKEALDNASGITDWRIHDLRRTFATVTTGKLGIAPHVIDKVLNHVNGAVKGVAAVYQRAQYLNERQAAMEAWGGYLKSLCGQ